MRNDAGLILILILIWSGLVHGSTFLGGSGQDRGMAVAVDAEGNIILAGRTRSDANFPVSQGAYDATHNGSFDVFVAKFDASLEHLLASTFIGGSGYEEAHAVIVDGAGDIYIAGNTTSADFPTTAGAYDGDYNGGDAGPYEGAGDVFVCRLNGGLTTLMASTLIGGSQHEYCRDMVFHGDEDLILSITTSSADFPTTAGAYDRTHAGGSPFAEDAALVRLSRDLSAVPAATFLGGGAFDFAEKVVVDGDGNVYVTGWTASSDFPTTTDAYDPSFNTSTYDAFVSRLDGGLSDLQASTFLGGRDWDFGMGICLNAGGDVYVTGHTASRFFPTTEDAYDRSYSGDSGADEGDDVFVARFDGNLSTLVASTFLGGSRWENGTTVVCDAFGRVLVGGTTNSPDFPVTAGVTSTFFSGGGKYEGDLFITRMDADLSDVLVSTYFGGVCDDHLGRFVQSDEGIVIAGSTCSLDWPVVPESYQPTYRGGGDALVSVLSLNLKRLITSVNPVLEHPASYRLTGSFPNPFNSGTTICFELAAHSRASLHIHDVNGRVVRSLFTAETPSGTHRIVWDGRDDSGSAVMSGTYFCKLDAGGHSSTIGLLHAK